MFRIWAEIEALLLRLVPLAAGPLMKDKGQFAITHQTPFVIHYWCGDEDEDEDRDERVEVHVGFDSRETDNLYGSLSVMRKRGENIEVNDLNPTFLSRKVYTPNMAFAEPSFSYKWDPRGKLVSLRFNADGAFALFLWEEGKKKWISVRVDSKRVLDDIPKMLVGLDEIRGTPIPWRIDAEAEALFHESCLREFVETYSSSRR